jgi:RNase H-fold protein (predicted Holliday junction resolvase)
VRLPKPNVGVEATEVLIEALDETIGAGLVAEELATLVDKAVPVVTVVVGLPKPKVGEYVEEPY